MLNADLWLIGLGTGGGGSSGIAVVFLFDKEVCAQAGWFAPSGTATAIYRRKRERCPSSRDLLKYTAWKEIKERKKREEVKWTPSYGIRTHFQIGKPVL